MKCHTPRSARGYLYTIAAGATMALGLALAPAASWATVFQGTLFYTNFTGGNNVNKVSFNYDDATNALALGAPVNLASTPGADGIIFAPNGNLLIGGQTSNTVFEVDPSTGAIVNSQGISTPSYHLALDPGGQKVYTSAFGGPLQTLSLPIGSGFTTTTITGDDGGVTQIAFAPDTGNVFYINGQPNGFGNIGTIVLASGVTTRLFTDVRPAHGMVFDPFTGLMTMFGAGAVGTMDQNGGNLKTAVFGASDYDQGAVDGKGHALIAGSGAITFVDYRQSGDITNPDFFQVVGGFSGIDDVAPLVGLGSAGGGGNLPEPATLALTGLGLVGLGASRRRRRGHSGG